MFNLIKTRLRNHLFTPKINGVTIIFKRNFFMNCYTRRFKASLYR